MIIALENSRESRDNIVVLNFHSVSISKTFTELVHVCDWLKNFGWFNKFEDINKYDKNQKCQLKQIGVVKNEVKLWIEPTTLLVWGKLI